MGDVAMCAPVVERLRADHPYMRITILTRPNFHPFFRDIESIGFLTPDFKAAHKGFGGLWRLSREIAALEVDAVADLHDVLRTKILRAMLRLQGKRVAVIDKGRGEKRVLTRKFRKIRQQLVPTVKRYADVFARLGVALSDIIPPPHAPRPLSEKVKAIAGPKKGIWIGVSPFAQHPGKVYPTILCDALIGLLGERYGRVFVFGGGTHEQSFAEHMEQRHPSVTSMIGKVSLAEEMDLVSNLDCMVSMDSVAMHMASLMGTPVVSVWGATHPYAGFYGLGQRPEDAVQLDLDCRPCSVYGNKPCMYKDYRCMNRIPPTTILEHVARVMERSAGNQK